MRALDHKLLRDLLRRRGQWATIAVVVACGVAAFVAAVSTYRSLAYSRTAWYAQARFPDVFVHLERAPERVATRLAGIPGVSSVQTRLSDVVVLQTDRVREPVTAQVVSMPDRGPARLGRLHLREGRLPDPERPDEVVLAEAFAEAQGLAPGDELTAIVEGRSETLRVVGIGLSPEWIYVVPPSGLPDDLRYGVFWMTRSALEAALDMDGAFNDVVLSLAPRASQAAVVAEVDRILDPYGGSGAYGREDQPSSRFVDEELAQNRSMAVVIPAIFLGVAAFLLNVVLARVVGAERMQIATLKALGYSGRQVGGHYLLLVLAVVAVGVLAGIVLGALLGRAQLGTYDRFFRFPHLYFRLEVWIGATAAAVSLGAAVAAALGAVRAVARLPPAQAMRPDPPDLYRHGLVERLGLDRRLSPHALLVVRAVARRPLRAAFTSVGVALSVAILVTGSYFLDAIERLIEVHFERAQREDVALTFVRPVPDRALSELAHLPGVLHVEGLRAAPVRLHAGHRSVRTALTGHGPSDTFRRLLSAEGRPVALHPDGVVLGRAVAEQLSVAPGDGIRAERLDGDFRTHVLRVVGVVDDLAGLTAAMDRRALHRVLGEQPTVTSAMVQLDPAAGDAFYAQVRKRPLIAGVSLGPELVRSFRKTMGGIIGSFAVVLTAFAAAIAVGIVYNAARITFAERSRDLASLRVLGFTRREVAAMLLSELGLEFAFGIPLGMVIGRWLAWLSTRVFETDLFRIPLYIAPRTYGFAVLVVSLAGAVSAWAVKRMLDRFDLISVLKSYE